MEREYDRTLDLSRGQGTGMQSLNVEMESTEVMWYPSGENISSSGEISAVCGRCAAVTDSEPLSAPMNLREQSQLLPVQSCVSDMLMAAGHKCFGNVLRALQAVRHTAKQLWGCFASSSCWYGPLHHTPPSASHRDHDAYSTLASQCVKFLSRWSYSAWHLQILNFLLEVIFS